MEREGGAEEWWIPEKKIGPYILGSNIGKIPDFSQHHELDNELSEEYPEGTLRLYTSDQGEFSVSVENSLIHSVTCREQFNLSGKNWIGAEFQEFILKLQSHFCTKIEYCIDDPVEFEDGSIQNDIDIEQFSIFVTLDEKGIILSISGY